LVAPLRAGRYQGVWQMVKCNAYLASYTVQGAFLAITVPTGTTMSRDAEVMEQEGAFLAALVSAASFEDQGGNLTIANASGLRALECVRMDR